ncbi:hypothetical protein Poli38472_001566 [Pythium oligandrum]|uniref:DUF4246 domain-containing protein n=1 Tax=Pythium oligandrum TaxID=41045 RepID=A0A8K1CVF2_PYTOL|nr:hypothetical protein Poli38472_001566 [Pythium oligandrum]|eukprot:TMW69410.1 hypothetical protein Poli38472_001566 [Pythium oligandrum]
MEYHVNFDGRNEYKHTDDDSFQNDNEKLESFGQLLWYFALLIKTRELKTQPLEQWPIQDVDDLPLDCSPVVKEIQELLKGVRAARLDKSRVDALWFHIDRVMKDLDDIRNCVITTLNSLTETEELTVTSLGDRFISPGPVNETWMGDSLIPSELKTAFVSQVSMLENVPDEKKDWHPGGHVKILSYINNLHPVQHEAMYGSIASIFERFVPLFDRVLSCLTNEHDGGCVIDVPDMSYARCGNTYFLPDRLPTPESFPLELECPTPYTIKGTTVQVIVKIAEIHLTPEKPSYPGGSWHIEGTDAEQIVATGLYYFASENITESKLSFCVIVREPEYEQGDDLGMAAMYGLEHDELLMQSLGAATAVEDRCLVFPNTLQHKVEPFELADKSKPGVRKILAFFLVDPNKKIQSTSVIPPQQKECGRFAEFAG